MEQVTLTSVRVSWDGLLENSDCADSLRIKYWWTNTPNEYKLTEKFSKTSTNFIISDLLKYQEYAFVVVAIEDGNSIRTVDYNRSPTTSFTTSDNPEVTINQLCLNFDGMIMITLALALRSVSKNRFNI